MAIPPTPDRSLLLDVIELRTSFFIDSRRVDPVDGVSFHLYRGEVFGLVGESGSGKTLTALSVMGLVPPPGRIVSGRILFDGRDLTTLNAREMESLRGDRISMVFQEPMTSLNPVLRIGDQIAETLSIHRDMAAKEVRERTIELLGQVGFRDPDKRYLQYPHQLSGGQRQRVLIAMAIACRPSLIIADEPTTALDVATEAQVLALIQALVRQYETSLLFITHNLHIVERIARRIALMYAGRLLEVNVVDDFFAEPLHPYGKGLMDSIRGLRGEQRRLAVIPGFVPKLTEMPSGCKFHPRCPFVMDICREKEPEMIPQGGERCVRCWLYPK